MISAKEVESIARSAVYFSLKDNALTANWRLYALIAADLRLFYDITLTYQFIRPV